MPFDEFLRAAAREKPFLVDPYVEDPEQLYRWEADPVLREVRIIARTHRVHHSQPALTARETGV